LDTFDQIAKLVPLWNGDRGVAYFLDPTTNKVYPTDRRYSNAWGDIANVIQLAGARRFDRLVSSIKSVVNVPVVQEWAGWSSPYETDTPAIDGIGMRASGTSPSAVIDSACRATSSILRWKTKGWLLATDVDLGQGDVATQLPLVLDDLAGLGSRGFFVRADTAALLKAIPGESERKAADASLSTLSLTGVFYPENATNPANPQRLAGSSWWLPTPADGNRIDLGSLFYGYRMPNETVIWAVKPGRYKLRMTDGKKAVFTTTDGSDPQAKIVKGGVELNLNELPLRISGTSEIPIPEAAYVEAVSQFDAMQKVAAKQQRDVLDEVLAFRSALSAFEQNPGGSFATMRLEVYRLGYKLGDFIWQEAERTNTTNFSESSLYAGASGTKALILDTRIDPGPDGYYAEYQIPVRSEEEQEVWIAAKIPAERHDDIIVQVGGQVLKLPEAPIVRYGQGLGWYKLGTTRLAGNLSKVRISVASAGPAIVLDAILITPHPFTPKAVQPPLPMFATAPG
jgi:hypothetical protein